MSENGTERKTKFSWDSFIVKAQHIWGMIFRALFIATLGYVGYNFVNPNPRSIGDIPLAQLTLNDILNPILGMGIIIGCGAWFFHFPTRGKDDSDIDPYISWAKGSGYLLIIAVFVFLYFFSRK